MAAMMAIAGEHAQMSLMDGVGWLITTQAIWGILLLARRPKSALWITLQAHMSALDVQGGIAMIVAVAVEMGQVR